MLHHNFRRFLNALDRLNPAQIEDAQTKIHDLRRKTEAISEIEARTGTRVAAGCYHIQNENSLHARYKRFIKPFCGHEGPCRLHPLAGISVGGYAPGGCHKGFIADLRDGL